jgi:hypothetical protein
VAAAAVIVEAPHGMRVAGGGSLQDTNVLIPWYPVSYLTIASSGFFWGGHLQVPTRHCDLVVPVDGGWGRSN